MNAATTVSVSLQSKLLSDLNRIARRERRSRASLLREAAEMYVERKSRWDEIFACGEASARRTGLSEADILSEIKAFRDERRLAR